jgi:hypothetical protein
VLAFFTLPASRNPDFNTPVLHLARVYTDGSGFRQLAGPFFLVSTSPVWSKDGRSLLVGPGTGGTRIGPIVRIDAETGATESTGVGVDGLRSFDLSPDGSRVMIARTTSDIVTEVRALENVTSVLKANK